MPDGIMNLPYAEAQDQRITLGRRAGLTDQYLRVWRVLLFNISAANAMLSPDIVTAVSNYEGDAFTSEVPTGTGPGQMLHAAGLRIHFTVTATVAPTPNTAEITIYNLDDRKQDQLIQEANYVILQAGYLYGQAGTIFTGTIKMYKRGHDNSTDSYLKIYAADGDAAYTKATTNQTFAEGTKAYDILISHVKDLQKHNIQVGYIQQQAIRQPDIPRDCVKYGMTQDLISDFAVQSRAVWHILDQKFYFTRPNSYDQTTSVVVLTGATGLVGFPEQTPDGINLTCLINPALRVRQRIHLDNKSINQYFQPAQASVGGGVGGGASGGTFWLGTPGQMTYYFPLSQDGMYIPFSINYEGDSRGQAWYQYMMCWAIDSTADFLSAIFGAANWGFLGR